METKILHLTGKINFDVEDKTRKHLNQSSWKKVAMVMVDGEICEYYAWFINKRYNLKLNKPLRGAHVTFINDSMRELTKNGQLPEKTVLTQWEKTKQNWNNKTIPIAINLDPRTDGNHWWFNIPHEERELLQSIRTELGLGKPFYGLHLTVGYANERNIEHSIYLHNSLKNGFIK
jgi:hypothetical protein